MLVGGGGVDPLAGPDGGPSFSPLFSPFFLIPILSGLGGARAPQTNTREGLHCERGALLQ